MKPKKLHDAYKVEKQGNVRKDCQHDTQKTIVLDSVIK